MTMKLKKLNLMLTYTNFRYYLSFPLHSKLRLRCKAKQVLLTHTYNQTHHKITQTMEQNQSNLDEIHEKNKLHPSLSVLHFGRLNKKSSDGQNTKYCSRWCVLTYGIFTYFRTCDKAKKFLESLPCSNKNINDELTRDQHRVKFIFIFI